MTDIGAHLLGRKPSPPDERDYRAANYFGLTDPMPGTEALPVEELVKLGIEELTQTTVTYKRWAASVYDDVTTTHWWKAFNYFAQVASPIPDPPVQDKTWESKIQLDQGETGHCVGFGYAAWGIADPIEDTYSDEDGHAIYYETKEIEGDPQGEDGAYVRDGAKAMQKRGRLQTYAFLNTSEEILKWIRGNGTVVVGTNWTYDMFYPMENGLVSATGDVAGGHCYLMVGVEDDCFVFKNSWGSSWGDNGYFLMLIKDWIDLFYNQGEAVATVELPWG